MEPSKRIFGTDGIRGRANQYPMTAEVALSLGRALAFVFRNGQRPRILVGKDTRLSSYMIEMAIASGICSHGGDAFLIGPMPTPGIAFLTQAMRADAGVVISASHNSFEDNGIKIFDSDGFKLPDEVEAKLEKLMTSGELDRERPTAEGVGKAWRIEDARGRYIEFVKSSFPKQLTLEGLNVVVDCAHGATYNIAPIVFSELGANVHILGAQPNGRNINQGVGAVHPERMAELVRQIGADIGVALDGDGDRAVFANEKGAVIDGDAILAVTAEELIRQGRLRENTLVATVMSNRALENYIGGCGGKMIRTPVGDRYVVEKMREGGYSFGGETSGHLVFLDHATTGDGLIAALQVMALMKGQDKKLSEITSRYRPFPQILKNIKVRERKDLSLVPGLQKMVQDFEGNLGESGRVFIRYSGTEPLVRIMIEGKEDRLIQKMASDLSSCIEKNLA